jgi:methionyl aminopeptidase
LIVKIIKKSGEEIKTMEKGGRILAELFVLMSKKVKSGVSGEELDLFAEEFIKKNQAKPAFKGYKGFPATICFSVNEVVVHGIPGSRRLRDGEIVGIDIGLIYKGYYTDAAKTFTVGEVPANALRLINTTKQAFYEGMKKCIPGNRLGDVSSAVQSTVEKAGYSVVRELVGHGIGRKMHEDPQIPNYGALNEGPLLESGMTLAIEPMVNEGKRQVIFNSDGWTVKTKDSSLSAHYENTIVIEDQGPRILTKL